MRIILINGPHHLLRFSFRAALLALAVGCGGSGGADTDRVKVVASFYPLAEVARQVGGERVEVIDLTPPGVEPHDLELTSRQVERLEDAELVIFLGRGFQPEVEAAVKRSGGEAVEVLDQVPVDADDPHVWLDPTAMARIVDLTQAALTESDPAGRQAFAEQADTYRRQLSDLDAEYRAGLASCTRRVIVTAHDSFGYLARRYGLTVEPISGLSPEAEPDPQRLSELVDLVRRQGATTVFTESLVPPDVAETLAREAGLQTAVLDPVEGLSDAQLARGENYLTIMRANLQKLRQALGC